MPEFIIYLLRVSAWFIPLYLLYIVLFRRFTFFTVNRFYLLLVVLVPFIMPFVQYTIIDHQIAEALPAESSTLLPGYDGAPLNDPLQAATGNAPGSTGGINWMWWMQVIYCAGLAWTLTRFAGSVAQIVKLVRRSTVVRQQGLRLALHDANGMPASFFNYIFISNAAMQHPQFAAIMAHETAHVQKRHTLDLLLCSLVRCILWFNPAVWFCRRSLQEVHEFEADRTAAGNRSIKQYAGLLLQLSAGSDHRLLHAFSIKPVKTRIKMLFTAKTNFMKRFAYLLLLPLVLVLLMAYGNITRKTEVTYKPGSGFVLMIDAGHGGTDPGATIQNGLQEKDINLALALQLQQQAEAAGIKVIMTRTGDEAVALQKRTELAAAEKASLIVSLHTSIAGKGESNKNGIEFYAGQNNNPLYATASLQAAGHMGRSLRSLKNIEVQPGARSRNVGIWILKQAPCPSVLVECGYLNHPGDAAFLSSEENRAAMTKAMLAGIMEYATNRPTGSVAGNKNPVLPIEAKVYKMHTLQQDAMVIIDGKPETFAALAAVNPAKIKKHLLFEPGNQMALKQFGMGAEPGVIKLETISGNSDYGFSNEAEKQKWQRVAEASRRAQTTARYEQFTYTDENDKTVSMYVLAGGNGQMRQMQLRRHLGDENFIKFYIDNKEVTEGTFKNKVLALDDNDFAIVVPKTGGIANAMAITTGKALTSKVVVNGEASKGGVQNKPAAKAAPKKTAAPIWQIPGIDYNKLNKQDGC